jgi:hypothetical protein
MKRKVEVYGTHEVFRVLGAFIEVMAQSDEFNTALSGTKITIECIDGYSSAVTIERRVDE